MTLRGVNRPESRYRLAEGAPVCDLASAPNQRHAHRCYSKQTIVQFPKLGVPGSASLKVRRSISTNSSGHRASFEKP
jgi:hypothetical protein